MHKRAEEAPFEPPVINLPGPGTMQPALSDYTRLLDTFLAGRSPRTLAACQADLEDYRPLWTLRSVPAPTAGDAVRLLLGGPEWLGERVRFPLPVGDEHAWLAARDNQPPPREPAVAGQAGQHAWPRDMDLVGRECAGAALSRHRGGRSATGSRDAPAARAQPGAKGLRDVALLRLLHDLGLRRSEAVRLDTDAVDLQRNRIFVPGRERAPKEPVSLPEPTRAALAAWLEARGPEPGPLFVNFDRAGKGNHLTGAAVYHIVSWLGAKAGLTVRPHGLRHLAITTALDRSNGDVRAVAKFSRHQDLRTLSRYRDNRPDLAGKVASLVAAE